MEIFLWGVGIAAAIYTICMAADYYTMKRDKRPKPSRIPCPPKSVLAPGMKYQRLTIKTIIRWEQMRGKSFSQMDYTDKEDIESLLYVMYITSDKSRYTFEVFRQVLTDERFMNAMSSDLGKIMEVVAQFQRKTITSDVGNSEGSPENIGKIVSTLIMAGLDAHYALNEMELCDLPLYIEAYEKKVENLFKKRYNIVETKEKGANGRKPDVDLFHHVTSHRCKEDEKRCQRPNYFPMGRRRDAKRSRTCHQRRCWPI